MSAEAVTAPSVTARALLPGSRVVAVLALALPLLTGVPLWAGYLAARPPERVFLGFRHFIGDELMYASFARQSADEGRFFMENRFTAEAHARRYAPLFPWLVGWLARLTGQRIPLVWEETRIVLGVVFLVLVWRLVCGCFATAEERIEAFAIVALSGGLGWLAAATAAPDGTIAATWADFWSFSTFGALVAPMWIAACCVWLLVVLTVTQPSLPSPVRWIVGLVLPPLAWGLHPYTGTLGYATLALFVALPLARRAGGHAVPWDEMRVRLRAAAPALASLVVVAAYVVWAQREAAFAVSSGRSFAWHPIYPLAVYPIAYGLLLPLGLLGVVWRTGLDPRRADLLLAWLLAAFVLSRNPFTSGIKFQYLVHLPLAVFAAAGLTQLRRRWSPARLLRGRAALLVGVLLFGHAVFTIADVTRGTAGAPYLYLSDGELRAFAFLDGQPRGVTLCTAVTGNYIPWLARQPVVAGHWFLTPAVDEKIEAIRSFFAVGGPLEPKQALLREAHVRWVYVGPLERALGDLDPRLGLERVYDAGGVAIYRAP